MRQQLKLPEGKVTAVVLGNMQDGGIPHIGCRCHRCQAAYLGTNIIGLTSCLGIVDNRHQPAKVWLIDASPDIKYQLDILGDSLGLDPQKPDRLRQPEGIFLTHGHMGHTTGLAQLGPEGMNVQNLHIYASGKLINLIQEMSLWRPLVNNLTLFPLAPNQSLELAQDLVVTPISVTHRDEVGAGTFGYLLSGPSQSLLYVPDIDSWASFENAGLSLNEIDTALVDATFFSREEVGIQSAVTHPLITETIEYWSGSGSQIILTHINHTNSILDQGSVAQLTVDRAGFLVAFTGQVLQL